MRAGGFSVGKWLQVPVLLALVILCSCGKNPPEEDAGSGSQDTTTRSMASRSRGAMAPMDRLQWNLETLVGNYLASGHRDPAWDESATNALVKFALLRSESDNDRDARKVLADYCRTAVLQGCEDPVILYLYTRHVTGYQEGTTDQMLAEGYKKAIRSLRQYSVAPIREAYLALRTAAAVTAANSGRGTPPEVHHFRHACLQSVLRALDDPGIPTIEAYEVTNELLGLVSRNPQQHTEFFGRLEPVLDQNWPDDALILLLKGRYHIDEAWRLRGSGTSEKVTSEGWKGFEKHLGLAEAALEKGWKLTQTNVEIPYEMMRVELGQGRGRKRLEQWFDRAMKLNTNGAGICKRKLYYLEPKWHGSFGEMLQFARECASSDIWGGEVLLMPLHAHETIAGYAKREGDTNYWKNPRIWREIKGALDRYYSRYPEDVSWRHNYAMHAYRAEDWEEFNRQLRLFSTGTNFDYFGGRETFERMVENGRQHAADRAR